MRATCSWCHAIVQMPDTFDPKDPKREAVCSIECRDAEAKFRLMYSDEQIGLRNFAEFGINPNHRGGKGAKGKQGKASPPQSEA